jgi:hypothetical protein
MPGQWVALGDLDNIALPTLMKKVSDLVLQERGER